MMDPWLNSSVTHSKSLLLGNGKLEWRIEKSFCNPTTLHMKELPPNSLPSLTDWNCFFFFWKVPIDSSWKCYYITLIFSLSWLFDPLHHSWSYTLAAKERVSVFYWSRNNIDSIAGRSDYRSSRTNVSIVVDDGIHSVSSLSLSTHFIQPTAHISECSPQFGSRSDVDAVSGCRQRIV